MMLVDKMSLDEGSSSIAEGGSGSNCGNNDSSVGLSKKNSNSMEEESDNSDNADDQKEGRMIITTDAEETVVVEESCVASPSSSSSSSSSPHMALNANNDRNMSMTSLPSSSSSSVTKEAGSINSNSNDYNNINRERRSPIPHSSSPYLSPPTSPSPPPPPPLPVPPLARRRSSIKSRQSLLLLTPMKRKRHEQMNGHSGKTVHYNDNDKMVTTSSSSSSLTVLCQKKDWYNASIRLQTHPHEAMISLNPTNSKANETSFSFSLTGPLTAYFSTSTSTPLALAIRYFAPYDLIRSLIQTAPFMIRVNSSSFCTPLHEACVMVDHDTSIIQLLLEADEALGEVDNEKSDAAICANREKEEEMMTMIKKTRATLIQDVDGGVPLHLLIRRAFSSSSGRPPPPPPLHISPPYEQEHHHDDKEDALLKIIQKVIISCPKAVGIADKNQYEETPLIAALKSSLFYVPPSDEDDSNNNETDEEEMYSFYSSLQIQHYYYLSSSLSSSLSFHPLKRISRNKNKSKKKKRNPHSQLESKIYKIVKCMVQHYPQAASSISQNGNYTPLHSAVFHGRCYDTVKLLLQADERNSRFTARQQPQQEQSQHHVLASAALHRNNQGELPLHIACMRNESFNCIKLLANYQPSAIFFQDHNYGYTPFDWLWMRFVSIMLESYEESVDLIWKCVAVDDRYSGGGKRRGTMEEDGYDYNDNVVEIMQEGDDSGEGEAGKTEEKNKEEEQWMYLEDLWQSISAITKTNVENEDLTSTTRSNTTSTEYDPTTTLPTTIQPIYFDTSTTTAATYNKHETNKKDQNDDIDDDDDFDEEYFEYTRTIEPPVDFIQMRHVPPNLHDVEVYVTMRTFCVLKRLLFLGNGDIFRDIHYGVERRGECGDGFDVLNQHPGDYSAMMGEIHHNFQEGEGNLLSSSLASYPPDAILPFLKRNWKEDHIILSFWSKAVALLRAATTTTNSTAATEEERDPSNARITNNKDSSSDHQSFLIVHRACSVSQCCPPSFVKLCMALYPEQMDIQDEYGKVPLHYIASIDWYGRHPLIKSKHRERQLQLMQNDSDSDDVSDDVSEKKTHQDSSMSSLSEKLGAITSFTACATASTASTAHPNCCQCQFLTNVHYQHNNYRTTSSTPSFKMRRQLINTLHLVLRKSSPRAAKLYSCEGRLPLHEMIDSIIPPSLSSLAYDDGCCSFCLSTMHDESDEEEKVAFLSSNGERDVLLSSIVDILGSLVRLYPDSLEKRDKLTGLYPFMQAAAASAASVGLVQNISSSKHASRKNNAGGMKKRSISSPKSSSFVKGEDDDLDRIGLSVIFFLLRENPSLVYIYQGSS